MILSRFVALSVSLIQKVSLLQYMNSGALHLGNYNSSAHFNTSIEHPADINHSLSLQVQGQGYIKELTHGLPRRSISMAVADSGESAAEGGGSLAVETVDYQNSVRGKPNAHSIPTKEDALEAVLS